MNPDQRESNERREKLKLLLIDVLFWLGVFLWFSMQMLNTAFHILSKPDTAIMQLAIGITLLTQIIRGLLFHLDVHIKPDWFRLAKFNKRTIADTTVVFLLFWLVMFLSLHNNPQIMEFSKTTMSAILAAQLALGLWLQILSLRKSSKESGISIPIIIVLMLIFLAPLWLVADIGFSIYKFGHFTDVRDLECLITAAVVPMFFSVLILCLNDQRDRVKNTNAVIKSQILALPLYPLCFLALKYLWPANLNLSYLSIGLVVCMGLVVVCDRRKRAWLVKEKVGFLFLEIYRSAETGKIDANKYEPQLLELHKSLAEEKLTLKNELDHLDRANALMNLAAVELVLKKEAVAVQTLDEYIKAYNKVLELNPKNQEALQNKFKAVDSQTEAQRTLN